MKKVLAFLAAVSAISGSAYATGAVLLNNYDADKPIFYLTAGSVANGSDFYAQVLSGTTVLANNSGVNTFQIGSDGSFDFGFADVPGTADNAPDVSLTLRAFKGTSWDTATYQGSVTWSQTLGANPGGVTLPTAATLNVPTSVIISPIPEPSTIALGMLGAAALLIRRRK